MDQSKVKELVNANIKQMRWALQLQDWNIDVTCGPLEANCGGTCKSDPKRQRACIEINPAAHEDEVDVVTTLRHELLHVLHADFETYRKAVSQLVDSSTFNAIDEFFSHAAESLVARLERMLDHGLKVGAEAMCKEPT